MSDTGTPSAGGRSTDIDPTAAHAARVCDYLMGGKDNYPADRALGDVITTHIPTIKTMARANRAFLGRAVRYLAAAGVTQFLDIGTGIPSTGNTHEVAQRIDPAARVVYVDKDPIVLAHARALMSGTPDGRTQFIHADLRDPASILDDPAMTDTLDLGRPVAIMLVSIMMYIHDSDRPQKIIRTLLDAVPSGSYLVITHPTGDFDPGTVATVVTAIEAAGLQFQARSRDEFAALFTGTELVEPGIVQVPAWRPDLSTGPAPINIPDSVWYWAAIGRKG